MPYLQAQRTNSHTADLKGEIIKKIKNGYSLLLNKQQLKNYKRNIYLSLIDTGSDLTMIKAETWKRNKMSNPE